MHLAHMPTIHPDNLLVVIPRPPDCTNCYLSCLTLTLNLFIFSVSVGDEWYLCRLTLSVPTLADLQWGMFPQPYLGAVGPDAAPGSVVYRLTARQRDGTIGNAHFLLLGGE